MSTEVDNAAFHRGGSVAPGALAPIRRAASHVGTRHIGQINGRGLSSAAARLPPPAVSDGSDDLVWPSDASVAPAEGDVVPTISSANVGHCCAYGTCCQVSRRAPTRWTYMGRCCSYPSCHFRWHRRRPESRPIEKTVASVQIDQTVRAPTADIGRYDRGCRRRLPRAARCRPLIAPQSGT